MSHLPHLVLVPLNMALARQPLDVAARHRLRGSDAIYAAVTLRFGCALVTLDREQRERACHALTARYPVEVLAETE